MSIVDELAEVIEAETGNTSMSERIAKAVLDHLAAKAGDVRGMLPSLDESQKWAAKNVCGIQWFDREHEDRARIDAVLDLCGDRLAPVVGALKAQQSAEPDEPIADPAERARAVARILRGRGLGALRISGEFHGNEWQVFCAGIEDGLCYDASGEEWSDLGPIAIADAIQAEEARRAQEWAGDEGPT